MLNQILKAVVRGKWNDILQLVDEGGDIDVKAWVRRELLNSCCACVGGWVGGWVGVCVSGCVANMHVSPELGSAVERLTDFDISLLARPHLRSMWL